MVDPRSVGLGVLLFFLAGCLRIVRPEARYFSSLMEESGHVNLDGLLFFDPQASFRPSSPFLSGAGWGVDGVLLLRLIHGWKDLEIIGGGFAAT